MIKIIQTQLRDMPSSLLAELGSYRYSVFTRGEGWSGPTRLYTPGQEYDRFDCSDVMWLIAWNKSQGICGCARLLPWREPDRQTVTFAPPNFDPTKILEMSRFSACLSVSVELPLLILWHALQLAEIQGKQAIISATSPRLEQMFAEHGVHFLPLTPGLIQSEESLFVAQIPVHQPTLAEKYHGARRYAAAEVFSVPRVMATRHSHG